MSFTPTELAGRARRGIGRHGTVAGALVLCLAAALAVTGCNRTPEGREAEHMAKGKKYLEQKAYRKAAIEFKVAAQNMPKDAEPQYQLGMAYLGAGVGKLAYDTFQKTLELNQSHAGALYQMALFEVGDTRPGVVERGRDTILKGRSMRPLDQDGLGALALAEAKLGHKAEALQWIEMAEDKDPSNMRPAAVVVAVYAARGDVEAAREIGRALAERLPNSPDAQTLRAQVSLATRDLADADEQISKALQLKRDFKPALQLRLRRELMNRDPKAAEQVSQELANLPDKQMWAAYGRLLFSEHKTDEAIAEFERVLKEHDNAAAIRDEYSALLTGAGRKKEAEAVLSGTLAKDPKDRSALLQRATLEVERGELDAGSKDIRSLEGLKAFSGQLSYLKARILGAHKETTKQGDMLAEALKLNPRLFLARLELARLLIAVNNPKNALVILDQSSALEKRTAEYVFHRNMALMAAGQWEEAQKGVDAAMKAVRSPAFLYQDALMRVRNKDLAGAQKSLEAAFALLPTDENTLTMLGNVMRQQGQGAKYIGMLKEAAAKNPTSGALQLALGRQEAAAGDGPGAAAAFNAAKAAGAVETAETQMALLEMQTGAVDAARQRLTELAKTHDSAPLQMMLAEIETRRGASPAAAIQHYLKALQMEPQNVAAMNNMADFLSRTNKFDDALFWGQKALATAPASPVVEDTLGWIYYREGKYDTALPLLEKSAHDADRPVAHYHLAGVLAKLGDTTRGRKEYDLAVKQDPKAEARTIVSSLFEQTQKK